MRNRLCLLALFTMLISLNSMKVYSQDAVEGIASALKDGNSGQLGKYLNRTVELEIIEDENMYSKAQAELMLKDFFSKNEPTDFIVNHQGSKAETSFAIGILVTSKGSFRVSIFMKSENDSMLIHQLRIERSD
ncbi:MAG: DUF4783 domain-containing protein [Bacteroidales bacterium]